MVFGLANSSRSRLSIFNMNNQIKQNKLKKLWRIEKITEYRYNEELKWHPEKLTIFHYRNNNFLEGTIIYNDYSIESKKYTTRIENRNGRDLPSPRKIKPLIDVNIENWSKEKGTIWLTNEKENKIENYQFRLLTKSNQWHLYNLEIDTFENNRRIQRYWFSDIDPGNYPIQESKELFTYNDTLLTESLSMSRKGKDSEWISSRRENFEYQNGSLIKRELFFYFEDENKWKLSESEEFISEEQVYTKTLFEYNNQDRTKSGYKIIEKKNASEDLKEKVHLEWNDAKGMYDHFYTERIYYKNDLAKETIISYSRSGYFDKYATFREYDSLNRLVKIERKTKNDEDEEWTNLSGTTFSYYQENILPSTIRQIDSNGELTKERTIIVDDMNNPISRSSLNLGRRSVVEIKHDYSIDSEDIIGSEELKFLETKIEDHIYRHNSVPIERIYYRMKNGEKIKNKMIKYTFKTIE